MRALDYIKKGWTQHYLARDLNGNSIDPSDPLACKWCAVGAIYAAYPERKETLMAIDKLVTVLCGSISPWNDAMGRTRAEVIDAFERAGI
jgi:hypothetical protein